MNNKKIFVSGPINLIRMEGYINNIKKVFYFFMDLHLDPYQQTECTDIRSQHIRNYLVDNFDKMKTNNIEYDFFLETFPDFISYKTNYTDIYLKQMRNMFSSVFSFDFKKNVVNKSLEFPNVRFHYLDIRSYLTFRGGDPFGVVYDLINYIFEGEGKLIYIHNLIKIKDIMNILSSRLNIIYESINNKIKLSDKKQLIVAENIEILSKYTNEEFIQIIGYLINKLITSFKHKNVKDELNNILFENFNILVEQYNNKANEIHKYLESVSILLNHNNYEKINYENKKVYFMLVHKKISQEIFYNLSKLVESLFEISSNIYVLFMDIFFLRRILDKDYIKHGIIYTGAAHSANYIRILLKNFNFTITHCYYSEYEIPELINQVKKTNNAEETMELFFPPILQQCIEMSKFPKFFS